MKFAVASGQRVEAYPGGTGECPGCHGEVIAKCGTHRIPHWAHRGIRDCDPWTEKETEWHRAWKNKFPAECQEVIQYDEKSGEKHIADVRTPHGLVIEFQHSHLNPEERVARERFYGSMLWVVDGTRLRRDYPRFVNNVKNSFRETNNQGYFLTGFPDECFPPLWLDSSAPVIFDFRVWDESQPPETHRGTRFGACFRDGRKGVRWLWRCRASNSWLPYRRGLICFGSKRPWRDSLNAFASHERKVLLTSRDSLPLADGSRGGAGVSSNYRGHRARFASRVKTSGRAALDAKRTRRSWLGNTNAEVSALVPVAFAALILWVTLNAQSLINRGGARRCPLVDST